MSAPLADDPARDTPTRTLVLMRHAAAEGWSSTGDKGRHLTPDGIDEATAAGRELRGLAIQQVLCSGATRTRETFAQLGLDAPVSFLDALHNCAGPTLDACIGEVDDGVTRLLVIAHAPAIPALAADLAWEAGAPEADEIAGWFPTATFCHFTFRGSWAELGAAQEITLAGIHRTS